MALRGKSPGEIEKRCKVFLYGSAGAGKTTAAIQFPRPYVIDTERGAENSQYVKLIRDAGGALFQSNEFDEMLTEVRSLLGDKHEYRTLVIDPITTVFNDLIEQGERVVGTEFGRHYGYANGKMRHLYNLLMRLDMNVVVTAHSKAEYGDNMKKLGDTFDGWKKLDYAFDLMGEIQKRGSKRVCIVKKSRIEGMDEGDVIDPWNYAQFVELYGRDVLDRDATPVELASREQIDKAIHLVGVLNLNETIQAAWFKKAGAESWSEMPADAVIKCIAYMQEKIEGGTAAGKEQA